MRILMMLGGARGLGPSPGFDQVVECFYLLRDAGAELVLASPQGGDPPYRDARRRPARAAAALDRLHADRRAREVFSDTLRFAQLCLEDFDGAILVGAAQGAAAADDEADAFGLVGALLAAGKPVAIAPDDERLAAMRPRAGLLIIGERPPRAAQALLGVLGARAG